VYNVAYRELIWELIKIRIIKSVSLEFCLIYKSDVVKAGAELVWTGVTVCWGIYSWRTWLELVLTRWKKSSSAVLNNSEMTGMSLCGSPTVCCDVATNQDVRGRQLTHARPRWCRVQDARDDCCAEYVVRWRSAWTDKAGAYAGGDWLIDWLVFNGTFSTVTLSCL